ncbi:hypothetical protein, partial [Singulisphaera acidiphila]
SPGWEESHWSLDAVAGYLTGYAGRRKVGVSGAISVYNRDLYIGVIYKKETVYLSYNPLSNEWVVADDEGRQLSRQTASEICRERIMTLTVTCKQPNKRTGDKWSECGQTSCRDFLAQLHVA